MLWLALQFPRLGLEVWDQAAVDRGKPVVLLEDSRVVLRNNEAAKAGILPGCTLATAHSIVADLAHFHRDEIREQARLKFLAETLYRFSSQVSLIPPDGIVLEVGASLALFGDASAVAREAQSLSEALGHRARWRLAATPLAALAMARADVSRLEEVPLHCAGIPAAGKLVERFANMGMHSLASLLELPPVELGRRFGPDLLNHLDRLTGRAPDPRRYVEPSPEFEQGLHLLEPVKDKDALLAHAHAPMQRLLRELSHWLVAHQLGAEQLIWSFSTHTESERVVLPLRFALPQQSEKAFLNVVRLKLERVELPDEILNVRLKASKLVPWLGGSRSLFRFSGAQGRENGEESGELIDQLRARLGERACSGLAAHSRHAPEDAWALIRPDSSRRKTAPSAPPPRPLWLFDPPHPTDRARLILLKGPERILTNWWREAIWRDYYVASLDNGATCWAFVDPHDQWYLHGYFG